MLCVCLLVCVCMCVLCVCVYVSVCVMCVCMWVRVSDRVCVIKTAKCSFPLNSTHQSVNSPYMWSNSPIYHNQKFTLADLRNSNDTPNTHHTHTTHTHNTRITYEKNTTKHEYRQYDTYSSCTDRSTVVQTKGHT